MAEIRIDKKVGNVNQAWRMQGSNAMAKFRVSGVNDQGGKIISDAMDNLSNAIGATLKLRKQLQDDADDMELVKLENLNREEMTRMAEKFTFESEDSPAKASAAHRKILTDWINGNKILSAQGKQRANLMLEKMNGLYQNSAQMRRLTFLANNNINEAKNTLEMAMAAGNFALAEKWRSQLDAYNIQWHGKPSGITPEDVKSKTAVSAYLNSSRKFGIAAWRMELEAFTSKEGNDRIRRNEDGTITLLGMKVNQADAASLEREIRQRIAKQINDGADMLDKLHVSGGLTAEKLEELHGAGLISAAQYNQQRNFLERKEAVGRKDVALMIYEQLFDFDPTGKSAKDIEAFEAYINENIASAGLDTAQRLELRAHVRKMFKKTQNGEKKAENPWASERGKELRSLIENKYYVKKGKEMDPAASDRKLQILSAGARLLMADNQSKKISEIMEQLNALDTGMKEGEYERILIGRGGVRDPQKWGKAFDSRELRKKTAGTEIALAADDAIAYRKRNGWVDKADIEVTKNINGRKAWVMKDGRVIYADEYEQQ